MTTAAPKILLAEDDAQIGELVRAFLSRAGYTVFIAPDGEKALELAKKERPNAIVLDVMMPKMNGYQVCRKIQEDERMAEIPVLFVTVKASVKEKVEGLRLGAIDYITKPFEPEELKARIEAALRIKSLQDDLRERNEALQNSLKKSKDLAEAKEALTHLLVHDLKAPLTGVLGTLDMLTAPASENPLSETQKRRLVELCLSSTRQVLRMVEEILEVQELEEQRIKLEKEDLRIVPLAELVAEKGRHLYPDHKVQVETVISDQAKTVHADRGLIERVLDNLVSNAVKFSRPEDTVTIRIGLDPESPSVLFAVEDHGPGIPDEFKEKVFEKFYRIQLGSHAARTGSGLGLSFCRLAVEAHQGQIWIENNAPRGSKFCFKLPA